MVISVRNTKKGKTLIVAVLGPSLETDFNRK